MNARPRLRSLLAPLLGAAFLVLPYAVARPSQDPPPQQPPPAPAVAPGDTAPVTLPQGTRIFLKDGNYLLAREYKIQNDRVRYWSVERSDWEEIPTQLVDWDATHKGEAEDAARRKQIDEKLQDIAQRQRAASLDVDTSIEVAPGVYLPDDPGFYIVADRKVIALSQDLADATLNKKRLLVQIISPIPIVPTKHDVDIKDAHAKLRVRDAQPEFYFRTADQREPNVALVRAQVKGSSRHISEMNTLFSETHLKENQMLLERWMVARGTFRYTLAQKLDPGEYAFIESLPEKGLDLYVWDFGVDSSTAPSVKIPAKSP
jgi:hypothetical protein